jgi:hypothetical protein
MRIPGIWLAALLLAVSASAQEKIKVTGTKRTVHASSGGQQTIPTGKTALDVKNVVYEFSFQSLVPSLPKGLHAEWMVLVQSMNGDLVPGTIGKGDLALEFGRPFSVTTDPVKLEEREWRTTWTSGQIESKIAGWGVRVKDGDDKVVSETYSSESAHKEIAWKEEQLKKGQKSVEDFIQRLGEDGRRRRGAPEGPPGAPAKAPPSGGAAGR